MKTSSVVSQTELQNLATQNTISDSLSTYSTNSQLSAQTQNTAAYNPVPTTLVSTNQQTPSLEQRRAANQNQFIKLCHFLLQPELSAQGIGNAGCE